MKVICNRGALLDALNLAGSVVAQRTPKPILQCLRLTAADGVLTVAATDLEVAIRYRDEQVQIDSPGDVLVPADKLRDIVRESLDDTLSIEIEGDTANIRGQDAHFKIFTQRAADFPPVPDFEGEADFQIPGGALKGLIGQTLFAAARESTRYAFNGVLVVAKGKKISMIATDGRRLALAKGDLASDKLDKDGKKAIVPSKALQLIEKLLTDPQAVVSVQMRENQIIFHTDHATLTSNLVEGQFPPYEDVIPKDSDKKMTAPTADFLSAIRRSALLTTEESKGVRLAFNKKGVVLTSRSPESGEATINFACKFEGSDIEIGFNPQFVADALRVVNTDEISVEMTAPNRPGLLKAGQNFLYVIMPVNLQ
ncbi:MAG: DNA polymerase III subunit beta [Tepidisphaeraceae bacterium]|jgi:DNA polymerase-3 subunit beta